jgi:hypothetical protein
MPLCTGCNEERDIEDFRWKDRAKGKRQSHCKYCHKIYSRNYYEKNTALHKSRAKVNGKRMLNDYRSKILTYLSEHPCVDCGEADPVVLDFDHVRGEKRDYVSALVKNKCSWNKILEEIEKCEIRCANCHRRKTARERGYYSFLGEDHL